MPGKPRVNVDEIRERVRARVEASSIRAVAEEIGISRGGLTSFLEGRRPYSRTEAKVVQWAVRERARGRRLPSQAEIAAAIEVLRIYIEGSATPEARRRRRVAIGAQLDESASEGG